MKVTWTIRSDHGERNAKTHWAPGITADRIAAGGFALACSGWAPTSDKANVVESLASVNCSYCIREMERAERRSKR